MKRGLVFNVFKRFLLEVLELYFDGLNKFSKGLV